MTVGLVLVALPILVVGGFFVRGLVDASFRRRAALVRLGLAGGAATGRA